MTESGKIIPRNLSGLTKKSQIRVTHAIKRARNFGLEPEFRFHPLVLSFSSFLPLLSLGLIPFLSKHMDYSSEKALALEENAEEIDPRNLRF